jgi:hypothetical protein
MTTLVVQHAAHRRQNAPMRTSLIQARPAEAATEAAETPARSPDGQPACGGVWRSPEAAAFFYSKEKLGYLVSPAVDVHALAPDGGVARARQLLATERRAFVFLHVSGLEFVGMRSGWLSQEYLGEARSIAAALGPLLDEVTRRGSFLVVITSDHAGHGLEHGTDHPDDARLPLVLRSDTRRFPEIQGKPFEITGLLPILSSVMAGPRR